MCCVCLLVVLRAYMCSHYSHYTHCVREKWYTKGDVRVCGLSRFEHLYCVRLFLDMDVFLFCMKYVSGFAP